jgi:MFS family permease
MQATAQGWLVLQLTNSPGLLGLLGAIAGAPTLVLVAVAGVFADRMDRRRLLVWGYWLSAALSAVLAILTTLDVVAYWEVAVIAFLGGIIVTIQMPAGQALVSSIVDRALLGSAIALNSAQYNVARIIGPSFAGLAIAAGGLVLGFWGNAAALLVVGLVIRRLPIPAARTSDRVGAAMWGDLQDGVRLVVRDPVLRALVVLAAVPALFVLPYLTFLPVYARDILSVGAPGLGLLTGSIGIGALAGALLVASRRPSGGSGRLVLAGLAAIALSELAFAESRFVPVSMAALAFLGASQVAYYSTTNTLLQVRVAPRMRGRVHSLYVLTSIGLLPIGNLVAGAIAERTGVPFVLAVGALATLGAAVLAAVPGTLRGVEALSPGSSVVGTPSDAPGSAMVRETFAPATASDGTSDR